MKSWQTQTSKYFFTIIGAVFLSMLIFIMVDNYKSRQVKSSLSAYMDNLRDMIFMSSYDSLKKGNMKFFKSHLEEIGTFSDVREFSLLDKDGVVRYSSNPELVKQIDRKVLGLEHQKNLDLNQFTTYYFPVETISYCSRCHPAWKIGSINSYYKLTLSRAALDAVRHTTLYSHGFTVLGGVVFLGFIYLLFTLYERKKHEEQMHLSASVFEHAVEAMVVTSYDGQIEMINKAFSQITQYSAEEIIGQNIHIIDAGEVNLESYQEMRKQLRDDGLWSGEIWNRKKTGENFPVRLSVTAVRNIRNHITHYVSVFYDISTRKAAEDAMLEMDQMKNEFISTAAHELRTPLSAMMGFAELLKDSNYFGDFSEEQIKDFLNEIYDRGEALSQLIDDLLDVGRIESGKPIELNLEEVCLVDLLSKILRFYRIHKKSHRFSLDLFEKSEETLCLVDRHRINQVIENLLSNSVKYSPAGSEIILSCALEPNLFKVTVADHGIGMTQEQVERIFDKFYRADSSNTAVSGLGLGMSVAKQIVEVHNGRIWVESRVGEGTVVSFTLPRSSTPVASA